MSLNPASIVLARAVAAAVWAVVLFWCFGAPRAAWVGLLIFCVLALCVVSRAASAAPAAEMTDMPRARLQVLDKATARTAAFTVEVEQTVQMGPMFIRVVACQISSELSAPESAAFIQVWEEEPPEFRPSWVFSGWMFASSPAVSAMDHPVYDVWVVSCLPAKGT